MKYPDPKKLEQGDNEEAGVRHQLISPIKNNVFLTPDKVKKAASVAQKVRG